jgi:hypothetical protein
MLLNIETPINSLSFGNCSANILFEFFKKKISPTLFLIGNYNDSSFRKNFPEDFFKWLSFCATDASQKHKRDIPTLKLWHLNNSLSSLSNEQYLFTFYELDSPTKTEINIANNQKRVFLSSSYAKSHFDKYCSNIDFIPLGFDTNSFKPTKKKLAKDGVISFGLAGKLEKRKQHHKVLKTWALKYGNNPKYVLNCAITNPFIKPEAFKDAIGSILQKDYFNINFLPFMEENSLYNDYLNNNDIIIGMSSGEGWGLPEFQSVCLGKHAIMLNAHSYKEWANEKNSVLVEPLGHKIPCYDNIFFFENKPFNQGQYFDWNPEDFLEGCEKAVKRFEKSPINEEGLNLAKEFTWEKTADGILKAMDLSI